MLGVMSPREAMRLAEEADLDLVRSPRTPSPPYARSWTTASSSSEQAKKEKENRRNQKVVEIKEVQLSMTIDVGDLNVKAKQATKFLGEGNKVKVSIRLRGRQMAHANLGRDVMNNFFEGLKEIAVIEKPINMEGRNIIMILAPKNLKKPRGQIRRGRINSKNSLEDKHMPKQKSHSGSKKRFWLTGTGKVNRPHGGKNHKAETKNRKRKRNLRQTTLVSATQENTVKKMIPYKD